MHIKLNDALDFCIIILLLCILSLSGNNDVFVDIEAQGPLQASDFTTLQSQGKFITCSYPLKSFYQNICKLCVIIYTPKKENIIFTNTEILDIILSDDIMEQ